MSKAEHNLSVIIPVYNVERYLDQCILSIINEIRTTDEVILVDDGSKDSSGKICDKYRKNNVTVVHNTNGGVSVARNSGLLVAKNEYITFVDADDYLLPGWRNIVEQGIEKNCDVVYFSVYPVSSASQKEIIDDIICIPGRKKLRIRASACWGKLYKREYLINNKMYFEKGLINGEDGIFSIKTVAKSKDFCFVTAPEFYYYRTDNNISATHTFNPRLVDTNITYANILKNELKCSGLFSAAEISFRNDFVILQGLLLLTKRLSYVQDAEKRKEYYKLFENPFYLSFYDTYNINSSHGIVRNVNFILSKMKLYYVGILFQVLIGHVQKCLKKVSKNEN